jgi:hypothetical protein
MIEAPGFEQLCGSSYFSFVKDAPSIQPKVLVTGKPLQPRLTFAGKATRAHNLGP